MRLNTGKLATRLFYQVKAEINTCIIVSKYRRYPDSFSIHTQSSTFLILCEGVVEVRLASDITMISRWSMQKWSISENLEIRNTERLVFNFENCHVCYMSSLNHLPSYQVIHHVCSTPTETFGEDKNK